MKIATATRQDTEDILTLQRLACQGEGERYGGFTLPPLLQTLNEIMADFDTQLFLKAVIDSEIVGSVRAYEKYGTCYVGRLIVHPDFQNRGIGTHLMDEIESRFAYVERYELFTGQASEMPLHIYEKRDYKPFRIKKLHEGLTLVYLEKRVL